MFNNPLIHHSDMGHIYVVNCPSWRLPQTPSQPLPFYLELYIPSLHWSLHPIDAKRVWAGGTEGKGEMGNGEVERASKSQRGGGDSAGKIRQKYKVKDSKHQERLTRSLA